MAVQLHIRQLDLPPGQRVLLHCISWQEFEDILEELGEHRAARIAYSQGTLEIRMPLPEHEVQKEIISDMVKILLEELGLDWECFGSTTFKRAEMEHGIEPDNCFYIANHARMIGKTRLDLSLDPPPDLVIEIDLTSKTQVSAYTALRVPEIWQFDQETLKISTFQNGQYFTTDSRIFAGFPLGVGIPQFVRMRRSTGTRSTLRAFRQWVREQIGRDLETG